MESREQFELFEEVPSHGTLSNIRFIWETPLPRRSINPLIWIKYTLKISNYSQFYIRDNNAADDEYTYAAEPAALALRQGWAVARGIDSMTIKINDKNVLFHVPREYLDPLSRMFISKSEAEGQCSGGVFDNGSYNYDNGSNFNTQITAANMNRATSIVTDFGHCADDDNQNFIHIPSSATKLYNTGLLSRQGKFYRYLLDLNTSPITNDIEAYLDEDLSFEVWEPLPINPFTMFPKFMPGYPLDYIKRLEVSMQMNSNLNDLILFGRRGTLDKPTIEITNVTSYVQYNPPLLDAQKKPVAMPRWYSEQASFDVDRASDAIYLSGETGWFTFDIRPESVKVYLYIQRRDMDFEIPTENFLGIETLYVKTPNVDYKVDSRQLFDMWRAESRGNNISFDDWRRTKSVCVLDVAKLRLKRRVKFKVKWRNYWKYPRRYAQNEVRNDTGTVTYDLRCLYSGNIELHS